MTKVQLSLKKSPNIIKTIELRDGKYLFPPEKNHMHNIAGFSAINLQLIIESKKEKVKSTITYILLMKWNRKKIHVSKSTRKRKKGKN